MKKLLLFCSFIAFCACGEITYDGETRLVTQTRIVDSEGNPIVGGHISISVSQTDDYDVISNGMSDNNGETLLIFPAPTGDSTKMAIRFSANNYLYKEINTIYRSDFTDYKFTLSDVRLYRNDELVNLHLNYNQVNTNTTVSGISVDGQQQVNEITSWHPHPGDIWQSPDDFTLIKNHDIILHYTINNFNTSPVTVTPYAIPLAIGTDNVDYTIDY